MQNNHNKTRNDYREIQNSVKRAVKITTKRHKMTQRCRIAADTNDYKKPPWRCEQLQDAK